MKKINLSYAKSGVNIKAADKFVKYISSRTSKIKKNVKSKNIGGFGAISKIPNKPIVELIMNLERSFAKANGLNCKILFAAELASPKFPKTLDIPV